MRQPRTREPISPATGLPCPSRISKGLGRRLCVSPFRVVCLYQRGRVLELPTTRHLRRKFLYDICHACLENSDPKHADRRKNTWQAASCQATRVPIDTLLSHAVYISRVTSKDVGSAGQIDVVKQLNHALQQMVSPPTLLAPPRRWRRAFPTGCQTRQATHCCTTAFPASASHVGAGCPFPACPAAATAPKPHPAAARRISPTVICGNCRKSAFAWGSACLHGPTRTHHHPQHRMNRPSTGHHRQSPRVSLSFRP